MSFVKHKQKGISVVIVVLLISVMVAFAAGASLIATESYRQIGRVLASNEAYYGAESSLEQALLAVKNYGTGFSQSQPTQTEIKNSSLLVNYESDCLSQGAKISDNFGEPFGTPRGKTDDSEVNSVSVNGVNCDDVLAQLKVNRANQQTIKADWRLTTSSLKNDTNFKVQLKEVANNPEAGKYYSVPIAGTGNAGGTLCGPGQIIPLENKSNTEKNGMKDFIEAYNEWLKGQKQGSVGGNVADLSSNLNAADHPCHWNRLYVSDVGGGDKPGTVTIPLFTQELVNVDNDGIDDLLIRNPANSYVIYGSNPSAGPQLLINSEFSGGLGFDQSSEFYLRFRTPCKPLIVSTGNTSQKVVEREMCNPSERYLLNDKDHNDVVVAWTIHEQGPNPCGTVIDGLCSSDANDPQKIQHTAGPIVPGSGVGSDKIFFNDNSAEIRESFINDYLGGILDGLIKSDTRFDYKGYSDLDLLLKHLFTNDFNGMGDFHKWRLYKPILELVSVSNLDVDTNGISSTVKNLPYLEYQLVSSTSFDPFSDVYQTITAQAIVRGLKQTIKVKMAQGGNLLQYVIQQ